MFVDLIEAFGFVSVETWFPVPLQPQVVLVDDIINY